MPDPARAAEPVRRAAHPRRRGPRDRHQRRRPGTPLRAGDAARPGPLRRVGRLALGRAAPCASSSGRGSRCWSSRSPTIRSRSARWPRTWRRSARTSSTPTCIAPRRSRRARSSPWARPASAGRTWSRPRIPAASGRSPTAQTLLELTPQFDRLIAVSKSSEAKLIAEGRATVPISLIYNGVDLQRYDHQEPCCTLPEEYGMEPGSKIVGVVARLEPEKGHPTLLEAWPRRPPGGPRRLSPASSARAVAGTRSRRRRASCASPTGSSSPAAATTCRP